MKAIIEAAFPICIANGCVSETTGIEILIQDRKVGSCIIINNTADAHFTAYNPGSKNITFVAVDKCIWGDDSGHQKCDFSITDSETFAFVEIKDTKNRSDTHKKNSTGQLEETIKRFLASTIDFTGITLLAIISWRWRPSRPAASTKMQSASVHFQNSYKVDLLEGNEISF